MHNIKETPTLDDYKDQPALMTIAQEFNETYVQLLQNIHIAVTKDPGSSMKGIGLMYKLKYGVVKLMNIPIAGTVKCAVPLFD